MAEPKTKATEASVDDYIAAQPEARQADCRAVVALMSRLSGETAVMWGPGIVGFGRYPLACGGKKVNYWPRIGFASRKQDLTLYVLTGSPEDAKLLAALGPHKTGKSCLYLKRLADVDAAVLERLCVHCLAEMERLYPR